MKQRICEILPLVSSPARYLGGERNAVSKKADSVRLRFALAFPDLYEVAMCHVGLGILYHILNARQDIAAERVFAPWADLEHHMRIRGIPLVSLESFLPVREFHVLGFSLQYELSYTNVLNMLELAGIPAWARDRDERYPLVIGGGPCTTNPEPVADFFDAFLIGEGEEAVLEICDCVIEARERRLPKALLLRNLSKIEGVYVPSLFEVAYRKDGTIEEIVPLMEGCPFVRRRILPDLDLPPYPSAPVVPWLKTIHDRLSVEIARGCKRGCRFCHAGFIYRPYRERKPERVEAIVEEALASTGYEEISLLSLSSGDYTSVGTLLKRLVNRYQGRNIAVSFPSLRVETLEPEMLSLVKRVRKTGFTLAPEAATSRLRRVINKEMDEERLLQAADSLYRNGWNLIKLYFMTGLPTESEEDLREIVPLARRVLQQGKGSRRPPRLNVSLSTFVPKAHTPFQWEPQLSLKETEARQEILRKAFSRGRIRFKWHDARMSLLEGVFSRGDRRLSRVLYDAFRMGCRFDGWTESFRWDLWRRAFEKNGMDMTFYTRARDLSEILPWSHIRCGITEEFLQRERDRARKEIPTPPCHQRCTACGSCDGERIGVVLRKTDQEPPLSPKRSRPGKTGAVKFRVEYQKLGPARFLGHLDMARAFHRAARRGRIPLSYSQGFHPAPRISFRRALPLGFESLSEEMEWRLESPVSGKRFASTLNDHLPQGLRIRGVQPAGRNRSCPDESPEGTRYLVAITGKSPGNIEQGIRCFMEQSHWFLTGSVDQDGPDIRPHIEIMRRLEPSRIGDPVLQVWSDSACSGACLLELILLDTEGGHVRVDRALASILGLSDEERRQMRILKVGKTSPHDG
ncbi:MAG: TIGR03960 family B12-binding radical SAM protein [Deltaproteobacteria bacterium]|nr:TIGR03960 family B12-binding radical SAM protein [Deltaproteobacteria bacterium]